MDALQRATLWANSAHFDDDTMTAANAALRSADELEAAFGTELAFGTGGLRGILGVGTARMNEYTVARATLGLARYLKQCGHTAGVAIAYDSRHCSEAFAQTAALVLASEGICAHVFPTLVPTPVLSYAVRALHLHAGIMITASHNPAQYNGYKVYGADGCQITDEAAAAITRCISDVAYDEPRPLSQSEARARGLYCDVGDEICRGFEQACLFCRPDPAVCTDILVAYTPLHGTGLMPVRAVLGHMQGVKVVEVEQQCTPDGDFPTCPSPNPELDSALAMGLSLAAEHSADLLLATDPDCDRVGVAVRDENGYRRLSGNEVGLLLMDYILRTKREQGTLPKRPVVIKTIVTSDLAFSIAKLYGAQVIEVLTGFKYIGEQIGLLEKKKQENRFVFGFEESCGYLAGTHVRDKDGVMACMLVCEMAQAYQAHGISLSEALDMLYQKHGYMQTALLSFDIGGAQPMKKMTAAMENLRKDPPKALAGQTITTVTDYLPGVDGLPASDVLRYETADGLKLIVRPSGTEPKVKMYLSAKAPTNEAALKLVEEMKQGVQELWDAVCE